MIITNRPPPVFKDPSREKLQTSSSAGDAGTRDDLRALILRLWQPILALSSPSNARCCPGATGVIYDGRAAGMEGFCRPLWGVLACAAHGQLLPGTELLPAAVAAGVDPAHVDHWGDVSRKGDQRCVEMAVLGWGLMVAPHVLWEPLDEQTQSRFVRWLSQINGREMLPSNNWRFFRILVNLGLRAVNQTYSMHSLEEDIELIESCYLGDGWYSDGPGSQRDYYVPMAMHFYGLLIAAHDPLILTEYTARYRERARLFAPQFMQWFVTDGSSLPYGRSLIYRFALGAFWSALAWAGEEALPWGVIKGLLLRHLRSWLTEPIFDSAGVLSIGYKYPNLNIAESYNSPASPYWAMKALLAAGLPDSHPFWRAEEEPLPEMPEKSIQPHPGFIIRRHENQRHITVLASGQYPEGWHLRHAPAKYAKFAYSTHFGFSVPVGPVTLEDGAYDNMLALSDDGHHWRVREKCIHAGLEDDMLRSTWALWPDVRIQTWLFFDADWQVRVHLLESNRFLMSAEAGHAIPRSSLSLAEENCHRAETGLAAAVFSHGAGGIIDPLGLREGSIVTPTPNSNLLHPRTVLPTLRGNHPAGTHWLITLLPATADPARFIQLLGPEIEADVRNDSLHLRLPSGKRRSFPVSSHSLENSVDDAGAASSVNELAA